MTGWDQNVLRAYRPAMGAWVAAVLGWLLLEQLQAQAVQLEVAAVLRWTVVGLLMTTLGHGGWVSWGLWRRA
ncbi:hypothetical protein [Stenotrophomonas sp. CFBP 13725]|uniref:hypothetical protein n=1 Tax=Stenotrophomonas sp. CFBP 13725 TaxID=2775297 RepID=UPI001784E25E|nr:hypothetical protein [Stenotrophomonas sp. CFBP 13725]MBD8634666.1 hypothetical protein [Stenotrophomonas sp. CFBP 13725]